MKKLFLYLVIRLTTRHALNAVKIYETIYHNEPDFSPVIIKVSGESNLTEHGTVKSKRQEIIDGIDYIKSKKKMTNADKESLYMLEKILENM